ncbi:transposase [Pontibacter qinzhouensis]|uniref:Transposase n=1 Tax=Pontibacter qinzhouensis TaxID=2603253 RepID=A0A5C8KB40_9BACT|nr:transposase [Pontibacter qinzhouensis]TXK50057.1 transposase [Pontibacter qinzhouensis]
MKEKQVAISRRKYDAAFKEEVLQLVFNGRPVSEVARSLGIGENLIYKWKSRSRLADKPATGGTGADLSQVDALHKRIRELETERDILKSVYSAGTVE